MATKIQIIPVLRGRSAEKFTLNAERKYNKKGTVDFSKEIEITRKILNKTK